MLVHSNMNDVKKKRGKEIKRSFLIKTIQLKRKTRFMWNQMEKKCRLCFSKFVDLLTALCSVTLVWCKSAISPETAGSCGRTTTWIDCEQGWMNGRWKYLDLRFMSSAVRWQFLVWIISWFNYWLSIQFIWIYCVSGSVIELNLSFADQQNTFTTSVTESAFKPKFSCINKHLNPQVCNLGTTNQIFFFFLFIR